MKTKYKIEFNLSYNVYGRMDLIKIKKIFNINEVNNTMKILKFLKF